MRDSIDVNQKGELGPNDGWRVELDRGVSRAVLYAVLRSDSSEVQRVVLADVDITQPTKAAFLEALQPLAQAVARYLNCGYSVDAAAQLWETCGRMQIGLPDGYRLVGVVEQCTRQNLYETKNGVRIVTEDEWAETQDPVTLVTRLHGELLPYVDPFADTEASVTENL